MTYALVTASRSSNFYPASTVLKHYGEPRVIKGITIHWWGDPATNPTFETSVAYLCRSGGNTSAHYVVEDGRVASIVADADAAWQAGSAQGNAETIGIECNPRQSDGDYVTIAALIADLRAKYGDLPLYPHRHWFATACPGTYDLARLDTLARGITPSATNPSTPVTPLEAIVTPEQLKSILDAIAGIHPRLTNVESILAQEVINGHDGGIRGEVLRVRPDINTVAAIVRELAIDLGHPSKN